VQRLGVVEAFVHVGGPAGEMLLGGCTSTSLPPPAYTAAPSANTAAPSDSHQADDDEHAGQMDADDESATAALVAAAEEAAAEEEAGKAAFSLPLSSVPQVLLSMPHPTASDAVLALSGRPSRQRPPHVPVGVFGSALDALRARELAGYRRFGPAFGAVSNFPSLGAALYEHARAGGWLPATPRAMAELIASGAPLAPGWPATTPLSSASLASISAGSRAASSPPSLSHGAEATAAGDAAAAATSSSAAAASDPGDGAAVAAPGRYMRSAGTSFSSVSAAVASAAAAAVFASGVVKKQQRQHGSPALPASTLAEDEGDVDIASGEGSTVEAKKYRGIKYRVSWHLAPEGFKITRMPSCLSLVYLVSFSL